MDGVKHEYKYLSRNAFLSCNLEIRSILFFMERANQESTAIN